MRTLALALSVVMLAHGAAWAATVPAERSAVVPGALTSDPIADLAANLDYDLERIHRFVSDEIRYEPYVGILRGAAGTLAAGAGNSADQSLLLAALLDESLIPYRFARGTLDDATTAAVIDGALVAGETARAEADRILVGELDDAVREAGARQDAAAGPAGSGTSRARATSDAVDATVARAATLLDESVTVIEEALREADVDLPGLSAMLPQAETDAHVWVQASFGADWLDLVPTVPGSEPGDAPAVAAETLAALPEDLHHLLEFSVLVERVRGGRLATEPIIEFSAPADRLSGIPISFGHAKPGGLERLGITVRNLLGSGGLQYNAAFDIAGSSIVGDTPISFGTTAAGGAGDGGLFDDDFFADDATSTGGEGPSEGEATAEWLELRYTAPGSDPVSTRRTIFDRVPPEQRYRGEPSVEDVVAVETVDLDGNGDLDYAPLVEMHGFAVATGPTRGIELVERIADSDSAILSSTALAYHYLRDILAAEIGIDRGVRAYLDGPNVASVSLAPQMSEEEALLGLRIDVWQRGSGTLPIADEADPAVAPGLVAGVLAHVAERIALDAPPDATAVEPLAHLGVGEIFELAAEAGIAPVVLEDGLSTELGYGPAASALIDAALAAGDVVVAPSRPVAAGASDRQRLGWWRIDPQTGATVDVMDDGAGTEGTEYQIPLTTEFRIASCLFALSGGIIALIVEILDMEGFATAKRGVSIAAILFQTLSAARGWTGACR